MTDMSVEDIEALVRSFDGSDWDEMRVVVDGFELYLSKNSAGRLAAAPIAPTSSAAETPRAAPAPAVRAPESRKPPEFEAPDGMVVVRAPNLGTFYRAPKPGAPPYVSLGQRVEAETELCLIEVMKLFTSVQSGVRGTVKQILAEDSQLVEFAQPLFVIDPLG
jgi:acetyl-CoA carboxylase biotin carboxyl carrier protein